MWWTGSGWGECWAGAWRPAAPVLHDCSRRSSAATFIQGAQTATFRRRKAATHCMPYKSSRLDPSRQRGRMILPPGLGRPGLAAGAQNDRPAACKPMCTHRPPGVPPFLLSLLRVSLRGNSEECRDPATSASLHVVEATAANRSGGRNTATPGGRVLACRAADGQADGRAFDELHGCPELSRFVRGRRAMSW